MDPNYAQQYYTQEDDFWWTASRSHFIVKLIENLNISKHSRILDLGCGGGLLIDKLKKKGYQQLYGSDINSQALKFSKARGLHKGMITDAQKPAWAHETFDLIIASDVVEHLQNDQQALLEWHKLLKPNGLLILFAPAFDFLWSSLDEVNHHFRRYNRSMLLSLLQSAGFQIKRFSFWNIALFFPLVITRFFQKTLNIKNKDSEGRNISKSTNHFLKAWLKIENQALVHCNAPVGVSIFAIGCKS